MKLTDEQKEKLEYFQKHALPWQLEHLKLRATGLQFFIPIQGVLFGAFYLAKSPIIPIFGLATCASLFLWDQRTRFIIGIIHKWGVKFVDSLLFERNPDGKIEDGFHSVLGDSLDKSGVFGILQSHTLAIRLLLGTTALIWSLLFMTSCLSCVDQLIDPAISVETEPAISSKPNTEESRPNHHHHYRLHQSQPRGRPLAGSDRVAATANIPPAAHTACE